MFDKMIQGILACTTIAQLFFISNATYMKSDWHFIPPIIVLAMFNFKVAILMAEL